MERRVEIMILFFSGGGEVLRDPVVRDVESELSRQPDTELYSPH